MENISRIVLELNFQTENNAKSLKKIIRLERRKMNVIFFLVMDFSFPCTGSQIENFRLISVKIFWVNPAEFFLATSNISTA